MYGKTLFPNNFGLAKRILTEVKPNQVIHQIRRNLSTDMFQELVSSVILPNSVYIDATYKCNRDCFGCYVKEKSTRIISHRIAEEVCDSSLSMKVNYITWLGGEPLIPDVQDLVLDISKNFSRMSFVICTNSDYLNERIADYLSKLSNVTTFVSTDGFEKNHDYRRGRGSYRQVARAMQLLKQRRLLFGYMTTIMPHNKDEVSSEDFVDEMINRGALIGAYSLFFNDLTLFPYEYETVAERLNKIAKNMPIYIISTDFGYMGNKIIKGSKRLIGITVTPSGDVKTERGGKPLGKIGRDGSLEKIILNEKTQKIFRDKFMGTGGVERDLRLGVLQKTSFG